MKKFLPTLWIAIPLWVVLLVGSPVNSEEKAALQTDPKAWMNRLTTLPPGPHKTVRPMKLNYQLSWKGRINAGKMEFVITEPHEGIYVAKAQGQSSGIARALFPYNFSGLSQTNADTLKPLTFKFSDKTKNQYTSYSILFQPFQMISETDVKNLKNGVVTPYRRVYRFDKDAALDLMSSILYLRSLPLNQGEKHALITATFNKPYLADFTVLGREKKSVRGKRYDAIKLDLKISKILTNMTTEPYSKINQATVWISDDAYRVPIEFQGEIFIGYISARLTKRDWQQ